MANTLHRESIPKQTGWWNIREGEEICFCGWLADKVMMELIHLKHIRNTESANSVSALAKQHQDAA